MFKVLFLFLFTIPLQAQQPKKVGTRAAQDASLCNTIGGTEKCVLIDTAGDVGIGTTGPDNNLHVHQNTAGAGAVSNGSSTQITAENSGNAGLQILSGNTNFGVIYFGDDGSATNGSIEYKHGGTPELQFWTDGTEVMKHKSGGVELNVRTDSSCGIGNVCSSGIITPTTIDSPIAMTTLPTGSNFKWHQNGTDLVFSGFLNSQDGSARDYGWRIDLPSGFTLSAPEDCAGNMVGADVTDIQVCRVTGATAGPQLVFSCTDGGGGDPTPWGGAFVAVCHVD